MKRGLNLVLTLCLYAGVFAQSGYEVAITLKPLHDTVVYLGYYYGNKKALADSVVLDAKGSGVFKGNTSLPGGVYFVVSPRKEILFELLVDTSQHFSISADTANLPQSVQFRNSPDNEVFRSYTLYTNQLGTTIRKINAEIASGKSKDSVALQLRLKAAGEKIQHYRDSLMKKYPQSVLTAMFNAIREPVVPTPAQHPGGKFDSVFAYRYYRSHYWDGVSFTDGRLVRTPFFESKLERYYRDLVPPHPDSINREVDHMLLYSRTNREMFKFLMVYFVQKYINPEFMGQDAVFVHLFEKYINTGQTDFFTDQYREFMNKRAYSLMANQIGLPAANLDMVDSAGKPMPLYSIKSDFIVICFWDPTCSHCKETVPRVDSMYHAKWQKQGVMLYGVMVDGGKENWTQFIREHNLKDWVHVYQLPSQEGAEEAAGRPGYRQLYDVYQTPLLYLLDKDKRIIAKKLGYEQLSEVIDLKIKNTSSN